jgi:outer membrane protein
VTDSHFIYISQESFMKKIILLLLIIFPVLLSAQDSYLEYLISEGLQNNLALKQKSISVEQSVSILKQARGLFFPSLNIQARYSRAGGGREIEFPVGDLLNPVYQSLNDLLVSAGQPPRPFPILENERIPFLRKEEHETKLQMIQPVFQPMILFNYQLKRDLVDIQKTALSVFKRELVRDIQHAYYNYLIAYNVAELYEETRSVLEENLRVSKALYAAQKVTKDAIYRAQAELSAVKEEQLSSENQKALARSYLNFLINHPLETEIEQHNIKKDIPYYLPEYPSVLESAIRKREELQQIRLGSSVARRQKHIARSKYLPTISAVADYGYQGEKYRLSDKDDYWMTSMILQWNLFNGFQDQAQYEISKLELKKYEAQQLEISKQIKLEVRQAYDNCKTALQRIEVARNRSQSAKTSFEIIRKKYEQGMIPQIEFLDARTNFTNAEISALIAHYNFFIHHAQLERIAALVNINDI